LNSPKARREQIWRVHLCKNSTIWQPNIVRRVPIPFLSIREINMADVKHCTASPINDFEGFLHMFYCRIKHFTESLTEKLLRQVGWQGLWWPFWKWRLVEIFWCQESIRDIIIYPHMKWRWNRTMLNLCGIVAAILKMATGRNFSMSGINSGHHNLPTYEMSLHSGLYISLPYTFSCSEFVTMQSVHLNLLSVASLGDFIIVRL
jgi:hypothetical protein